MSKSTRWDKKGGACKHLPIYQHRAELLEAVGDSAFLLVTGETGSGKTTQLPQYLHQAGERHWFNWFPRPSSDAGDAALKTGQTVIELVLIETFISIAVDIVVHSRRVDEENTHL